MRKKRFAYLVVIASILLALVGIRRGRRVRTAEVSAPPPFEPPPFVASAAPVDDPYVRLNTLEDARTLEHTAVVMRGGDGDEIYLTVPVKYVVCDAATLRGLSIALDSLAYKDPARASLTYELAPIGSGILARADIGSVIDGVWINPRFADAGVEGLLAAVIAGEKTLDDALDGFPNALGDLADGAR